MERFLGQLIVAFLSLFLAVLLVPGVAVNGGSGEQIKILILAGLALGITNHFLRPIVEMIGFPLRMLTFGLFGLLVNMLMVWLIDILFPQLIILGFWPLFWTGLLVWLLGSIVRKKG